MLELKLSEIKQLEALAIQDPNLISLSQGALRIDRFSDQIHSDLVKALKSSSVNHYGSPMGLLDLRKELISYIFKKYAVNFSLSNILITHGCTGALAILCTLLLQADDEVILPTPTYPAYENVIKIAGARPIFLPLLERTNLIAHVDSAITKKTKAVIFANPSNPTGELLSQEQLQELAAWCAERKIYLIIDEVYEEYVFDASFNSIAPYILSSPYLIRVSSFSKNFAMSGWRIGYMIIPEHLFEKAYTIQDSIFICPSVIGQYAALAALRHYEHYSLFSSYIKENKNFICSQLQELKDKNLISFNEPAAAFYLFVKTSYEDTIPLCFDIAKKSGVTVVPGCAFGPGFSSYIRICFARERDVLEEGIKRLISYWTTYYV